MCKTRRNRHGEMCKRYRMKWRKTRESYVDEVFNFLVFFILLHSFICMCRNKTKCEKVQISPGRACYTTVPITHNTYTNTSSQKSALVFFFFFFFLLLLLLLFVCLFLFCFFPSALWLRRSFCSGELCLIGKSDFAVNEAHLARKS